MKLSPVSLSIVICANLVCGCAAIGDECLVSYSGERNILGSPWGKGKVTFSNCDTFEGEVFGSGAAMSNFNGEGVYTWADGGSYSGEWKDGKQHGHGTVTFKDGTELEGVWDAGTLVSQVDNNQGTRTGLSDNQSYPTASRSISPRDSKIERLAMQRLAGAGILDRGSHINITSHLGWILLTGTAASTGDINLSTSLIRELDSVQRIYNELTTDQPRRSGYDDTRLHQEAEEVVALKRQVIPVVYDGVVYLLGAVTEAQGNREALAVAALPLTQRVVKVFQIEQTDAQARAAPERFERKAKAALQIASDNALALEAERAEIERKRALEQARRDREIRNRKLKQLLSGEGSGWRTETFNIDMLQIKLKNQVAPEFCASGSFARFSLSGVIGPDSTFAMTKLLDEYQSCKRADGSVVGPVVISFNSGGGYLEDGYALGLQLRARGVEARILDGEQCASSCAAAFLGGQTRIVEEQGMIMFHSPYLEDQNKLGGTSINCNVGSEALARLQNYYRQMTDKEVGDRLFDRTMRYCSAEDGWIVVGGSAAELYGIATEN